MHKKKRTRIGVIVDYILKYPIRMLLLGCMGMLIILLIYGYLVYFNVKPLTVEQLDRLDLEGYNKLMIVAHPDDELIFGGSHLLDDDYLVLCITNQDDKVRSAEFAAVMEGTGDKGLMLAYPDKVFRKKSKWKICGSKIEKDIETVLNYKDWELVVTHNKKGEYGHIQHKRTHVLVDNAFENTGCKAKQYYFAKFYPIDKLPDDLERISDKNYKKKLKLAKHYKSQRIPIQKLYHLLPHESWQEK